MRGLQLGAVLAIVGWFAIQDLTNNNPLVTVYDLSAALPRKPDGWRRNLGGVSHPTYVTVGGRSRFTSSTATRTYYQGDKEITIEIWDWAGDYPYHMPYDLSAWGSGKEVRVGADQGRLRYNPDTKKGRLRVRYLDRFYVIVEGEGIERHELDSWYRRINLTGLRRSLEQLRRKTASR